MIYAVLTRDFGLVGAVALGARKEASKLRGGLEPVSLSKISLVRGKEYWRITSVEVIRRLKKTNPLSLLEKLVTGEASHPELFDTIEKNIDADEIILVAKILYHLGYLKESDLELSEKELIKAINSGIRSSQLIL